MQEIDLVNGRSALHVRKIVCGQNIVQIEAVTEDPESSILRDNFVVVNDDVETKCIQIPGGPLPSLIFSNQVTIARLLVDFHLRTD